MTEKYCDCHMKHSSVISRLEKDVDENHKMDSDSHRELWAETKKKMSTSWLFLLFPALIAWIGFQMAIYDSVKTVETKVAVIQTEINTYIKASNKRMD